MNIIQYLLLTNHPSALEMVVLNRRRVRYTKMRFRITKYSAVECSEMFRFDKADILRIARCLRLPAKIRIRGGSTISRIEGVCILLRRLAYPNRLCDLRRIFKRSITDLSKIINHMLDYVEGNFSYLITDLNQPWLNRESLMEYAAAISRKGSPLENCWGFIDGTVRPICRPKELQRHVFNGHKRTHSLKFQQVTIPNGIIANLFGPIEGRRHDSFMLGESGILRQLQQKSRDMGEDYYIYGDSGYPLLKEIIIPFKNAILNPYERQFNSLMSSVRISVEHSFQKILQLWAFVDFKKNQKLYLQQVGKYYRVACILTNFHTCIYGSQTGEYYDLVPPTLENYIGN